MNTQKQFKIIIKNTTYGPYSGKNTKEAIQNWLQEATTYDSVSEIPAWMMKSINIKEITK